VDTEENKCEIMDDYLDEFINSDDEYQQQIMESYEKEAQEKLQHQQQEEAIKLIQQAIKIKLEPITASTSNNDDEDSIATITID
jgi:hypothetical protein